MMVDRQSGNPQMVVLLEELYAGKMNLYPEQVSVSVRTKHCPFYDGSSPV